MVVHYFIKTRSVLLKHSCAQSFQSQKTSFRGSALHLSTEIKMGWIFRAAGMEDWIMIPRLLLELLETKTPKFQLFDI